MAIDRTMPWLGFPLAVDLANTVVVTGRGDVDLLTSEEELDVWVAAEADRAPEADAARGRLADVRSLREHLRTLLYAAAEGRPLPSAAVAVVNAASAAAPRYAVLRHGRQDEVVLTDDDFARFRAVVARSAIEVLGTSTRVLLDVCRAPSCGMLFLRSSARQKWCCDSCGNRARVARFAAAGSRTA